MPEPIPATLTHEHRDRIAQIAALLPRIKDLEALERVLRVAKEGARDE